MTAQTRTARIAEDVLDRVRIAEFILEGGDPLEALRVLSPIEDELAGHAAEQMLLGRAYFHSAQLERAQHAFEQVVGLDPADSYARFLLGRTLERRSRFAEALPHYKLAAAMSPRPDYRERLAEVLARMNAATTS